MFKDGPLTRRAPETIRYGTGRCALGALLVASSGRGIVSIMVRDTPSQLIRDIAARFPRHRSAAARVGGGTQDPLRRDLHLLEDRRSDRLPQGDPRRGQLLLA